MLVTSVGLLGPAVGQTKRQTRRDARRDAKRDDVRGRPEGPPYEKAYHGISQLDALWTVWSHVRAESTTLFYSGRRRNGPPRCVKDGEFFNEGWRPDEAA